MKNKSLSIKETFKNWKEQKQPYFSMKRDGTDILVQIKNPFILFDMQIGGCILVNEAIKNAQLIVSKLIK